MTVSSLTEETPATPGWVDARIASIFAPFGAAVEAARDRYAECLANLSGAADVELGQERCRAVVVEAVRGLVDDASALDRRLQALEAEIASAT